MSRDEWFGLASLVLMTASIVLIWWAFWITGSEDGRDAVRASAIEAGVAHWTIDAKTGQRKFEWIKPEGKE